MRINRYYIVELPKLLGVLCYIVDGALAVLGDDDGNK